MMDTRITLLTLVALSVTACSSPPPMAVRTPVDDTPPAAAPTTQAEVEQLRAENARLRAQLRGATEQSAVAQNKVAVIEANEKSIESGKLEPGMSVQEASRAINGRATLHKDTCQLLSQSDGEWTYRMLTESPTAGPGAGGASAVGTNMRGERAIAPQAWICVFDAKTGKLKRFRRDLD